MQKSWEGWAGPGSPHCTDGVSREQTARPCGAQPSPPAWPVQAGAGDGGQAVWWQRGREGRGRRQCGVPVAGRGKGWGWAAVTIGRFLSRDVTGSDFEQ